MNTTVLGHPHALRHLHGEAQAGSAAYCSAKVAALEPAPASTLAPREAVRSRADEHAPNVAVMRTALVVGSVVVAVITWLVSNGLAQAAEPELATLLRGMAAIKGLLAISAAGLVWWRLGQPVSARAAVAYMACTWALFAATVLIWQLAFILAAAGLFHAAGLVGLVIVMQEGRRRLRSLQSAAHVER